nr:SET domain-containing protein [Chlamydia sp. 17-3921]
MYLSLSEDRNDYHPYSIARASHLLNFSFLPNLKFLDWQVENRIRNLCNKSEKRGLISPLAKWLGKLHKQEIHKPTIPPVAICWINSYIGYGVFAREDIAPWTYLGEYAGILRQRKNIWMDENDYCFRYPLPLFTFRYFTIDSEQSGSFTRFINHSDQPNAEAIGMFYEGIFRVIIRSIQPIRTGEEICYHYGPLYWKHRKKRKEFIPIEG